jgi:hypothetical protein
MARRRKGRSTKGVGKVATQRLGFPKAVLGGTSDYALRKSLTQRQVKP